MKPATIPLTWLGGFAQRVTGWILFCPHNKNGAESSMWMRRGSSGYGFQVHIHCFHITGCGRVIVTGSAAAISSGCNWFGTNYNNRETLVALTIMISIITIRICIFFTMYITLILPTSEYVCYIYSNWFSHCKIKMKWIKQWWNLAGQQLSLPLEWQTVCLRAE